MFYSLELPDKRYSYAFLYCFSCFDKIAIFLVGWGCMPNLLIHGYYFWILGPKHEAIIIINKEIRY